MKRLMLAAMLVATMVIGCLALPERTAMDPLTGATVSLSLEDQIVALETEAAQLRDTITMLQGTAGLLPPPFNLIVMGILASLSAALEQQRRKLRLELAARDAESAGSAPARPA